VVVGGLAGEHTDCACLFLAHRFDVAHGQQPRQARLSGAAAPPGFSEDWGAGTTGATSSARNPACSAHMRRSLRSPATSAPVS
ncbi:MAG: hypothetical protein ACRDZN_15435, partial [Acidimicrobiales bacterium]